MVLPSTSDTEIAGADAAYGNSPAGSVQVEGDAAASEDHIPVGAAEAEQLAPRRSGRSAITTDPEPSAPVSAFNPEGKSSSREPERSQAASAAQQTDSAPSSAPKPAKGFQPAKAKPPPATTLAAPPAETEVSEGIEEAADAATDDGIDSDADSETPEFELDAFSGAIGAVMDSLDAAVSDERAFLRPSAEISELARAAAKVCSPSQFRTICTRIQQCRTIPARSTTLYHP